MKNSPPGNSTTLHSPSVMHNCQNTSSIITHPTSRHPINYYEPNFWLYVQHRVIHIRQNAPLCDPLT